MYSFEGNFKRKPVQALGGASKNEPKEVLLQRTQEERRKREEQKKRLQSAVTIQSFYRSSVIRGRQKQLQRSDYDAIVLARQRVLSQGSDKSRPDDANDEAVKELIRLMQKLLFFYSPTRDGSRLSWLCQQMVRHSAKIAQLISTPSCTESYRLKHVLTLCCRQIQSNVDNISMSLRMIEVYTDPVVFNKASEQDTGNTSHSILRGIMSHLISKGYYQCIRSLIETRLPASMNLVDTKGLGPQHAMSNTVLMLIKRPLLLVEEYADQTSFGIDVLKQLCKSLFSSRYSEPVRNFLLPTVSRDSQFPFTTLLHSMLPTSLLSGQVSAESVWSLTVEPSLWLLHSTLYTAELHLETLADSEIYNFLLVLYKLVPQLTVDVVQNADQDDSDDDQMELEPESDIVEICQECVEMLNRPILIQRLIGLMTLRHDQSTLTAVASICHALLYNKKRTIHSTRLLYMLAFNANFLSKLWLACKASSTVYITGSSTPLLLSLSRGLQLQKHEFDRIIPLVSTFCSLFTHVLTLMYDTEFYRTSSSSEPNTMPFTLAELPHMALTLRDVCLGIIELAHPDTKPSSGSRHRLDGIDIVSQQHMLSHLFKVTVALVRQLQQRDCRRPFCPEGHWLLQRPLFFLDKPSNLFTPQAMNLVHQPFGSLSILNSHRPLDEDTPRLSSTEIRRLIVLVEMPFVVSFEDRVKIFHQLVHQDKSEHQTSNVHFNVGPLINITVRRNYLYEDSFEKLSVENEPNMKLHMRVRLQNFAGLDEAGIDGGGIFREFMSELIKTSFDPNRGFFFSTSDKLLYPNPQARLIIDNFTAHYYFLGRILGKALFENMLIELPFASFFLSKILSHQKGDVDINHLASLDPEMYRNLLYLKDYDGDVSDLNLDFTVVNNELGEAQVEELKRGGRDIVVDNSNRIEYIHLMADYRLNRQLIMVTFARLPHLDSMLFNFSQGLADHGIRFASGPQFERWDQDIRPHCNAFRSGLNDVVNIEWLRLFDHNELQILISGAQVPIDIDDLRQHTNYTGGYGPEHPAIVMLWRVVTDFDDTQRRQLLKFVTSCSRPPLLGFKNLHPSFCVHHAGTEADRLPTASTCMNLLKLPEFKDEETLRLKLLYAIESGSGFELS